MSPAGFEPTTPASERPQTHAFDPAINVSYCVIQVKYKLRRAELIRPIVYISCRISVILNVFYCSEEFIT